MGQWRQKVSSVRSCRELAHISRDPGEGNLGGAAKVPVTFFDHVTGVRCGKGREGDDEEGAKLKRHLWITDFEQATLDPKPSRSESWALRHKLRVITPSHHIRYLSRCVKSRCSRRLSKVTRSRYARVQISGVCVHQICFRGHGREHSGQIFSFRGRGRSRPFTKWRLGRHSWSWSFTEFMTFEDVVNGVHELLYNNAGNW